MLGDIDYHADNADAFLNFFDFTIEEVKGRYMEFLHFNSETDSPIEQQHESSYSDQNDQEETEGVAIRESESNLNHEVDELKGENIQAAFEDHEFWKPQIDYNIDDLLKEMNYQTN